jgi:hypothetical protein
MVASTVAQARQVGDHVPDPGRATVVDGIEARP